MWYLSSALKPIGPFELLVLQDKIKKGLLGPHDLVFNQDQPDWKAAQDWDELRRIGFPAHEAIDTDPYAAVVWVVLHQDKVSQNFEQQGPFSIPTVLRAIEKGQIFWEDLVWKKGLSGWARLSDRPEFHSAAPPEINII